LKRKEKMKKLTVVTLAFTAAFIVIMASSFANASIYDNLRINVTPAEASISPNDSQQITATVNEKGIGIIFVIQPAEGPTWTDFLQDHPDARALWILAPDDIKQQIQEAVGNKIVSYAIVTFDDPGSKTLNFISDFTGINGAPSTKLLGEYDVVFAYASFQPWYYMETGFACGAWNVVPEVPLGTAAAACSMIAAVGFFKNKKRIPKI
jgi:hypothetical protein